MWHFWQLFNHYLFLEYFYTPPPKCGGGGAILDSLCRVGRSDGRSVGPSPILVRSITPLLMEGFPSNLNDTFTSTRGCAEPMFFPQHILPLLLLYNAQWWGYESLTAIALVGKTIDVSLIKLSVSAWSFICLNMKGMLLLDFEFCWPA